MRQLGVDPVCVDLVGEPDAIVEAAGAPRLPAQSALVLAFLDLAGDRELVADELDVHVLALDPRQLGLDPVLMAATNSSGGVMGKMISPQNIATGVSTTDLKGQEGVVFARTFWHSVILTLLLGVLVFLQQHVLTWMIPALPK